MSSLDFGLSGKLAVVTGGANGIGFATAKLLAASGASVAIFDLEREDPQSIAKQIGASGFAVDVTSRESLDAAFAAAGTPDIVIANAGIVAEADLVEQTTEDLGTHLVGESHRSVSHRPVGRAPHEAAARRSHRAHGLHEFL